MSQLNALDLLCLGYQINNSNIKSNRGRICWMKCCIHKRRKRSIFSCFIYSQAWCYHVFCSIRVFTSTSTTRYRHPEQHQPHQSTRPVSLDNFGNLFWWGILLPISSPFSPIWRETLLAEFFLLCVISSETLSWSLAHAMVGVSPLHSLDLNLDACLCLSFS